MACTIKIVHYIWIKGFHLVLRLVFKILLASADHFNFALFVCELVKLPRCCIHIFDHLSYEKTVITQADCFPMFKLSDRKTSKIFIVDHGDVAIWRRLLLL